MANVFAKQSRKIRGKERKYTKKNYRKRKAVTRPRDMVTFGMGFPKKALVTHKYRDVIGLTTNTGIVASYQFSTNGMFDPNVTGVGHQPLYFDQFADLYDHYTVIASKITFKLIPVTFSTNTPLKVAFFVNDDTNTIASSVENVSEQTLGSRIQLLPPTGNIPAVGTLKWSAKKTYGKGVLANNSLQGSGSSSPSEQSYFQIMIQAADGASTIACYVDYEVEYIAVWKELKDVAPS